jgi:RimJ/RimL family protein N-acetyltransferase
VIVLDPLRDSDSDALYRWIGDRELVELSATFRPVTRAEHDAWFAAVRVRDDVEIFAIREDGRLVGSCQLLVDGDEAELRIRIGEADARGRGLGTEAVGELVRRGFGDRGLRRVWLQVFADNLRAIRAYEKSGFARCGTGPGHTVLMELRAAPSSAASGTAPPAAPPPPA